MAGTDHPRTNVANDNWVKGVLVMRIADEAVRPFVTDEINKFHKVFKSKFRHGSLCGQCISTNAKGCQSRICSKVTKYIESFHRYKLPCYENSNIEQWLSDPWEIAKCYMSRSRDLKGKPGSEIDFLSIINVVINNTHFKNQMKTADITNKKNIFCQGRDARNETMHSRHFETTEHELKQHCDIFIEIVKLIARDSKTCKTFVERIEKVRDGPLTITTEDIDNLREQAARYQGLAEPILTSIKVETKTALGESLIPNFVEGCKEALYRLIVEYIQRLKTERIRKDDWTVEQYLKCLQPLQQMDDLSESHREMLFPSSGSSSDLAKWDIYLYCFVLVLSSELFQPLDTTSHLFIEAAKVLRDKLLRDPSKVDKSELSKLCDHFHNPMKKDILGLFEKERTAADMVHYNNVLQYWRREEDSKIYRREGDKTRQTLLELHRRVLILEQSNHEQDTVGQTSCDTSRHEDNPEEGVSLVTAKTYAFNVEIVPKNVSEEESDQVHTLMTEPEGKSPICTDEFREDFERKTGGMPINIEDGSIILKVECRSVERLFGFWKGCTDGTVVKALSKFRDTYRKYLGNNKLEFDIVLKKKEVIRLRNEIWDDLNIRVKRLEKKPTDVTGLKRQLEKWHKGNTVQKDLSSVKTNHSSYLRDNTSPLLEVMHSGEQSQREGADIKLIEGRSKRVLKRRLTQKQQSLCDEPLPMRNKTCHN